MRRPVARAALAAAVLTACGDGLTYAPRVAPERPPVGTPRLCDPRLVCGPDVVTLEVGADGDVFSVQAWLVVPGGGEGEVHGLTEQDGASSCGEATWGRTLTRAPAAATDLATALPCEEASLVLAGFGADGLAADCAHVGPLPDASAPVSERPWWSPVVTRTCSPGEE